MPICSSMHQDRASIMTLPMQDHCDISPHCEGKAMLIDGFGKATESDERHTCATAA